MLHKCFTDMARRFTVGSDGSANYSGNYAPASCLDLGPAEYPGTQQAGKTRPTVDPSPIPVYERDQPCILLHGLGLKGKPVLGYCSATPGLTEEVITYSTISATVVVSKDR